MIRFVFRFLGLWILAAAFIFLIYDVTKSIADRTDFFITKTSDVLRKLSAKAEKNCVQNRGAKRRVSIRESMALALRSNGRAGVHRRP